MVLSSACHACPCAGAASCSLRRGYEVECRGVAFGAATQLPARRQELFFSSHPSRRRLTAHARTLCPAPSSFGGVSVRLPSRANGHHPGPHIKRFRASTPLRAALAESGAPPAPGAAAGGPGKSGPADNSAVFSREALEELILSLQDRICAESAERDGSGKLFIRDRWEREGGSSSGKPSLEPASASAPAVSPNPKPLPSTGYGITRVLEGGDVLEKAAANVTIIRGTLSKPRAEAMSARQGRIIAPGTDYFAAALSLVFHSRHPHVPTFRSDIRFFEVDGQLGWFGGGADLTPFYLFPEDVRQFHSFYRDICERHSPGMYPTLKDACDKYFYLPARREHRGVGGIFFDDLSSLPLSGQGVSVQGGEAGSGSPSAGEAAAEGSPQSLDSAFAFVREVAEGFMESYWPIAERRRGAQYTQEERDWQLLRRGRYLEFNLLYDRGVRFGMDGSGRVASIMVSAPPLVAWHYEEDPLPGSREAELLEVLKAPRQWV